MLNDPKLTDNPLSISWHDSAWIPMLNPHNVMDYFSERSNPFYDQTCNNEVVKMQRVSPEQMMNMQGIEYCLLHVQEPILYVIRKQQRHTSTQVTPVADYYIIAGIVYQAPDLGSVLNSRILTTVSHLQSAFDEAKSYAKYHPSRGYWWDFGSATQVKPAKKGAPVAAAMTDEAGDPKKKKKKARSQKQELEKKAKEEPSSMFQRRRVDMILDLITRKYPSKAPATITVPPAAAVTPAEKKPVVDVKSDKDAIKTEPGSVASLGIKREASSGHLNKLSQPEAKKAKLS